MSAPGNGGPIAQCMSRMRTMPSRIDPQGVEPRAVLGAADFQRRRVLEIGSGTGRLTFPLAALAESVTGVDVKHADLKSALTNSTGQSGRGARFVCANACSLPFRDAQFDIALLASSL